MAGILSGWDAIRALASYPLGHWSGSVWRGHDRAYRGDDAAGSILFTGRYNRGRDTAPPADCWPALYTSVDRSICYAERLRHTEFDRPRLATAKWARTVFTRLDVELQAVLSFMDPGPAGLTVDDLCQDTDDPKVDYQLPHQIAATAISMGAEALLVPSATRTDLLIRRTILSDSVPVCPRHWRGGARSEPRRRAKGRAAMLRTYLTEQWGLTYPIVGAPMVGATDGKLTRAITKAGALGQIGVSSEMSVAYLEAEAAVARGDDDARFGIGLMLWALEQRPELFEAALAARPFLLALSFGSPAPYVERAHAAGVLVATQANTVAAAREAEAAGVDVVVAQGAEAGGHTGSVSTLPLLQGVLDAVRVPVLAAGGIATPQGLAAVLAAGAQGAWIGTALVVASEAANAPAVRQRIVAAAETDTIQTHAFDDVQRVPWPEEYPGRALRNRFAEQWHGRSRHLTDAVFAEYAEARSRGDYDVAVIYAGEAAGLVQQERSAAEIVREIGAGAEVLLRRRGRELLA